MKKKTNFLTKFWGGIFKKNEPPRHEEEEQQSKCILFDDACYYLANLKSDSQGGISGLQLNTIYEAVSEIKVIKDTNINSTLPHNKAVILSNEFCIDINRPFLGDGKPASDSVYVLPVEYTESFNGIKWFHRISTQSYLVFFAPDSELLKNKDSLILSDPEKKRNAIIEFNNFLTTQCFSLLENHYHKILVLKLLFSLISKDINNRQNRTLLYARDLLNKAFSNQNDIQQEDLIKQRLLEIDKNNLDEKIRLDAEIVYNSFVCAYNQLDLDTRNTIRAIYDDYSVKYENK